METYERDTNALIRKVINFNMQSCLIHDGGNQLSIEYVELQCKDNNLTLEDRIIEFNLADSVFATPTKICS